MKTRVALLSVVALLCLASFASAAGPAQPAASTTQMTPACNTHLSLPAAPALTPASVTLFSHLCGACSDYACVGLNYNSRCGVGLTCFIYNSCDDGTWYCVCSAMDP
jgi:hypothetical protein